ncbi:MAG: proprotein convertase P-domain-containing protein [bacterium]
MPSMHFLMHRLSQTLGSSICPPKILPPKHRDLMVGVCLLAALGISGPIQARQGAEPPSWVHNLPSLDSTEGLRLSPVSPPSLVAEDRQANPGPLRFAVPRKANITPENSGNWQTLGDGSRVWRERISCPGSTDLNLGFNRFRLPEGASLHVLSEAERYYEGPYGFSDAKKDGQLWLPVVPGSSAVVELFIPAGATGPLDINLSQVGCGYRDMFGRQKSSNLVKQGSCNIDVVCSEADAWRDEIRSVARYTINGSGLCTGTLIRDAEGSGRPFFLTANHCGVDSNSDSTVVVYWNFESPTCGALSGGDLSQNQTGSTFRAARADVDMTLLELSERPASTFNVYYGGWDRSGAVPAGSVGIHHPNGDEKAFSSNNDALTTVNSCIGSGGSNTHWQVNNWELGTTEPGSSGSSLWDPAGHRVVGFLSGGSASCSNPAGSDCYGKVSVAWDGNSPAERLKDWLDPTNTGVTTVDGSNPAPTASYSSHQGSDSCPTNSANENGIWEPGEEVDIQINLSAQGGSLSSVSGTLQTSTPGVSILTGNASWPNFNNGDTHTNATPFRVRLDTAIACLSQIDFQLQITTAETMPLSTSFTQQVGSSTVPGSLPASIPDNTGSVSSTLDITQDSTLSQVKVDVQISHTYVGDLKITLQSPRGTSVTLLDQPGVPGSTFGCGDNNMDISFDDGSGLDPETHCNGSDPWITGNARPTTPLNVLNGESSLGTWTLTVSDHAGGDIGQLTAWQLDTTPSLQTQCNICQAPVDSDQDGINDNQDNCRLIPNNDQRDTNADDFGNLCDPDLDNNLIVNGNDTLLMRGQFFSADADSDLSGDGRVNFADLAIMKTLFGGPPGPSGLAP